MNPFVRLCFVIHNHQPVGNFDSVIEEAYQDSYRPFLEIFEEFPSLKLSLHISGPLMNWLQENHNEYLDRIQRLVQQQRIEIIGGPYYEPILTMIPSRDRIGQIQSYSNWLSDRFQTNINGMWMPERVWEQSLTSDIAAADIRYTVLDDFHFSKAGLDKETLNGFYITEDQGRMLTVFPGSEELRYLIPFRPASETIENLREQAHKNPGSIVVFGDDGEKFGTWPNTKEHVYEKGWLREMFSLLTENQDWIQVLRLQDCIEQCEPVGKIFLPDSSYREMNEWAMPVKKQLLLDELNHSFENDRQFDLAKQFIGGGFWRNFKVRYPEANDMYSRMMYVSTLLQQAEQEGRDPGLIDEARENLYKGQCNCAYWHGAFGGIYLPHLRNAIFNHLITAENLIERANGKTGNWVEATVDDYNFDGAAEIRLANDQLSAWISPSKGGQIYGLDLRSVSQNLLATINRKPEAYHEKVKGGETQSDDEAASIHDRVVFKQEGLDQKLQYDSHRRVSLIDHFHDNDTQLSQVINGEALERGDFAAGHYDAVIRRNPNRVQAKLSKAGNAWGCPMNITKGITLNSGSNELEIAYLIEGLPPESLFHFSIEFNFSGMPAQADGRYFFNDQNGNFGHLGSQLDIHDIRNFNLIDQWQGIEVGFDINRPTSIWTFQVESVSQSESGFELVHQSVVVQPHWWVSPDDNGSWTVTLKLRAGVESENALDSSSNENSVHAEVATSNEDSATLAGIG